MLKLSFTKYHGAGNDFLLIDDRQEAFPVENKIFIQNICHRKYGVGADGVVLLCADSEADFRMRIFNSDGSEAEGCGNGVRCLLHFIRDLGSLKKKYQIKTGKHCVCAFFKEGFPVIDMGVPTQLCVEIKIEESVPALSVLEKTVHFINTGVPHVVQFVPDVDKIDLIQEGSLLRRQFQANVNFAAFAAGGSLRIRTFERGVEGETLSCGTGAVAVGAIAKRLYGMSMPLCLGFPGGVLTVWEQKGRMYLAGPVKKVFTGSIDSSIMLP